MKKILALAMVLSVLGSLIGCSGGSSDSGTATAGESTASTAGATAGAATAGAAEKSE